MGAGPWLPDAAAGLTGALFAAGAVPLRLCRPSSHSRKVDLHLHSHAHSQVKLFVPLGSNPPG